MTMRYLGRRAAAGAAAGLLLTTLVCGGPAIAADHDTGGALTAPLDTAAEESESTPVESGPTAPASPEPAPARTAPAEQAPGETSASAETATSQPSDPAPSGGEPTATPEPAPASASASASPAATADPAALAAAPAASITVPNVPASGWFTGHVNVSIDGTDPDDPVATITYQIDGKTPVVTPDDGVTVQLFTDGRHTVTAWATDAAGNVSASATRAVDIDTTGPVVSNYSLPPDSLAKQGSRVQLSFGCDDELSGTVSCVANGRLPDRTLDTTTLGEHLVQIVGVDKAGNTSITDYRYRVIDDNTPPRMTATIIGRHVSSPDWSVDENTAVLLQLEDENPEQTLIEYRVGRERWELAAGGSVTIPLTQDGVFDIVYVGRDAVGNSSEQQTITVGRDTVAPTVAIAVTDAAGDPLEDGDTIAQGASTALTVDCADATSGVAACDVNSANRNSLDTSTPGSHQVDVTVIDVAGNRTTARFAYTVQAPPVPSTPAGPAVPGSVHDGGADAPKPTLAAETGAASAALASTGPADLLPFAASGAALLLLGLTIAARSRRRRVQ